MSETKTNEVAIVQDLTPEEESFGGFLNLQFLLRTLILNWQWFILSLIICVGLAAVYVRYTPAVFSVGAKILVKEDETKGRSNKLQSMSNLGMMSVTDGFDNELELLKSVSLAEGVVRDLKLYVDYMIEGRVVDHHIYGSSPVLVDMDSKHLDNLGTVVRLEISRKNTNSFEVEGEYFVAGEKDPRKFTKNGSLPMSINTSVGVVTITANPQNIAWWNDNRSIKASISNPTSVAYGFAGGLGVAALSKTTTIANLTLSDIMPERAVAYLKQLVVVYNRQANEDKNQIAVRTEEFINQRLEKINIELGSTDGAIEDFKRNNNIIDPTSNASMSVSSSDAADNSLQEMNTQMLLMESIKEYMNQPANKYQTLPSNVGLKDAAATALITEYNKIALERNRMLRSASEQSPVVQTLTAQLDDLTNSILRAMDQSTRTLEIERKGIMERFAKYSGMLRQTPQQERFLTEIGRQQTVKSSLYIMLLQKREENSISLAATADKGKLIDQPLNYGQIKPKKSVIMMGAAAAGIAFPFIIFILIELLRFRIEGHNDVASLTKCPIIADIAMANEATKTKGDIVVHENKNNQMEEIFRGMRTNIQFVLKENENVIMFTSSTSGEGKTFCAANLAVSFALLGKKVLLVGLDIRRPRLSALFGLDNKNQTGITTLLSHDNPTRELISDAIIESGVNKNLLVLPAGPVPPNPSELVARNGLEDIFAVLREDFDYVIVDTAPVGLVTDTLQVGRVCDATVVMCRADYTEKAAFGMINDFAMSKKLPNVCVAINGVDMSKKKYGYQYGYGKYGKYGKYGYKSGYGYGTGGYGYGRYGYSRYGNYGYHSYGYGSYSNSHYSNPNDDSIKK